MKSDAFIEKTLAVWQPYYKHPLSREEGREILNNWHAYLDLIAEWTNGCQAMP